MGRADTAVTLMLICVQFAFAETQVYPGEHFNCNRYIDYVMKEWSCRPEGLFDISDDVMDDGIFTREELLEEISVRCSNVTLIERYINCFEELAVECPLQYLPVLNLVNEKIQMFCDGTDMSTWLLTTLENGYTYNKECFSVSSVLVESCAQELSATYQHLDVNMTMTTALEMLPHFRYVPMYEEQIFNNTNFISRMWKFLDRHAPDYMATVFLHNGSWSVPFA
ncbi:uncharacterized protein LOC123534852 isoform X2 [Mercenaria mercenaria]|uniref:uncharacterized protein LOC123534852 isoform X2 n=1 Tax=Mercenaria mercenaria TaxID=6596 RepID=UPI00234EA36F|nr:uncharacterized protein LOC123534852 isoform X2 [Mercenaria mercenaria]